MEGRISVIPRANPEMQYINIEVQERVNKMASGKEKITMIIGAEFNGDWVIMKAPKENNFRNILDGIFCAENGFNENELPKEPGVYEVECEVFWDDGRNVMFEHTDPDFVITILETKELVKF